MLVAGKLWKRKTVYKVLFNFVLLVINNSTQIKIRATNKNMVCAGTDVKLL